MSDDPFVHPDEQSEPHKRAEELFVHGLLGLLHDKDRQKARVDAAIAALQAAHAQTRGPAAHRHKRLRRLATLAGAALLVIAGVVYMQAPGGSSAYATVTASMEAARGPGERRYELRLAHWPKDELPEKATGTLDSAPDKFLMTFEAPDHHQVVVGKDEKGEWAVRLDGDIERDNPRGAWPHWAEVGNDSFLADSVDNLLENLLTDFELTSDGRQLLPGAADGSPRFKHIHGQRKPGAHKPQPQSVDLWIDPETKVLERLEMSWPKPPLGRGPGRMGDRAGPGGSNGDRGPHGDRPESTGPDARGPDVPPDGQRRRPPEDFQPGPPPFGPDGLGPPRDRPEGGPDAGPGDGDHPGPEGLRGPRPRLSRLVLTRTGAPAFAPDWFSPESHLAEKSKK